MALNKVPYVDGVTVITAENLNDIQDAIIALENALAQGLTEDMKQVLLQIARKVAYIDDQGQTYYDDLYDAFYPPKTVVLITAVFEQGSTVIYDDTALDDLKQYLTVTARYDDNTTAIVADSAYSLSGLLEAPSSTVTVLYSGVSTTFSVAVTARPTLSSITAVYTQFGTVYDTDTLDSLKADLVVTAVYSDGTSQTVAAADYTLSGELIEGTSTITVSYGGKTATFDVVVTHSNVPAGYRECEYIEGTGEQYISTGITVGSTTIKILCRYYKSAQASSEEALVSGKMPNVTTAGFEIGFNATANRLFAFSSSSVQIIDGIVYGHVNDVECVFQPSSPYATLKLTSGETVLTASKTTANHSGIANSEIKLFHTDGTAAVATAKMYYCKIYRGADELIFDAIPAYRTSDDVAGMFDKISGQFFASIGSAQFVKGGDV